MTQDKDGRIRELEARIADIERRHQVLMATLVDALITIDARGVIVNCNRAAEQMFGYRADELIGQKINMLMPEPHASEHDRYMGRYINTGQRHIIGIGREVMALRQDGTLFPIELAVSEMVIDGERQFTGLIKDITERKNMERLKNEFISTVSHELRTPLTSIRGALGLVISSISGEVPKPMKALLDIASNNTERLLLLINDILDIEKIESGNLRFDFRRINLVDLIRQAVHDCSSYAKSHGVNYRFDDSAVEHVMVNADAERMIQILNNLLSNAAKFSPDGGDVDITLARKSGYARISVRDHGSGIPKDFLPRLFDKFTQADSTDKRRTGGTGLGLSITKAIVEKHQGRITVESEEGKGTVFHVDLPLQRVDDLGEQMAEAIPEGARVLIVEDDPDIAHLIKRILRDSGFASDVAYDTIQARELLRANAYHAITLDLILPGQSGLDFLQELRTLAAHEGNSDIPVVVISVDADRTRSSIKEGLDDAVDWIQKPIDAEKLIAAIQGISKVPGRERPLILQVEDEEDIRQIVVAMLTDVADVVEAPTLAAAREALANNRFDLVLLDVGLPDGSGLELLADIKRQHPGLNTVIFSAQDVGQDIAQQVSAALVKSATSNIRLIQTIKAAIR